MKKLIIIFIIIIGCITASEQELKPLFKKSWQFIIWDQIEDAIIHNNIIYFITNKSYGAIELNNGIALWRKYFSKINDFTINLNFTVLALDYRECFEQYAKAPDSNDREFTAIYLMLKMQGLNYQVRENLPRLTPLNQIDNYRDDWWRKEDLKAKTAIAPPFFMTEQQIADAEKESPMLHFLSSAPGFLSQKTIKWTKEHSDDPRVPEALHLVFRSSRCGLPYDNAKTFTKAAFQILQFPLSQNPWTAKILYWFWEMGSGIHKSMNHCSRYR